HVRHAVDEHAPGLSPMQGLLESLWPEPRGERVSSRLVGILNGDLAKVDLACLRRGDRCGVAVVATGRRLRAAGHRIPGRVGPFNAGPIAHGTSIKKAIPSPMLGNDAEPSQGAPGCAPVRAT